MDGANRNNQPPAAARHCHMFFGFAKKLVQFVSEWSAECRTFLGLQRVNLRHRKLWITEARRIVPRATRSTHPDTNKTIMILSLSFQLSLEKLGQLLNAHEQSNSYAASPWSEEGQEEVSW
jgi:hypothetical protein